MISFAALQNTYQEIQVALWCDSLFVGSLSVPKNHASAELIPTLAFLLNQHNLRLEQLSFIAVNKGPGPFTTLRVVIASANGLSFASDIPLVGVDGLKAFLHEQHQPQSPQTVALLNAFGNDVYYAIESHGTVPATGYANIQQFLAMAHEYFPNDRVRFIGNGVALFRQEIESSFEDRAIIPTPLPESVSITAVGTVALEQWKQQVDVTNQVQPLYLKEFKVHAR